MLRFNDGENFDTSGEYRVIRRRDGYYVTGHGMLCPVDSREDGERFIERLENKEKRS